MLVDALLINGKQRKLKDPVAMRMDFTFDAGNAWADGFRIQVTHDLNANPLPTVSDRLGKGAAIGRLVDVNLA